jgi:amino acid adenylation domain-containing protein
MVDSETIKDFLARLQLLDVHLKVENGRLGCSAPKGVLTAELKEQLNARKSEVIRFLEEQNHPATDEPALAEQDERLLASLSQERFWNLQQSEPASVAPDVFGGLRFKGILDRVALECTLKEIIRRHQVLRTNLVGTNGALQAVVGSEFEWRMDIRWGRDIPEQDLERELWSMASAGDARPLDSESAPLIRATLVVLGENDHALLVRIPHVAADGWSLGIFASEVAQIYQAFSENRPSPLPDLSVQYFDYARWHREYCANGALSTHRRYWEDQLQAVPPLDLPMKHRQTSGGFDRECRRHAIPADTRESLQRFIARENTNHFVTLLSAFQILLFRYTRENDIVVWSTGNGRSRPEWRTLIGRFSSDLPLRVDLSGNPTGRELIGRTRDNAQKAFAHENISPEHLSRILSPTQELNRPATRVMFNMRELDARRFEMPGLTIDPIIHTHISGYDLSVEVIDRDGELALSWEYNGAMFDDAGIQRMQQHYLQLLDGLLQDPERPICSLPILTPTEQAELFSAEVGTRMEYPRDLTLHGWFGQQAVRTPDASAVVCGTANLTYAELNRQSNRLANRLRALGVAPGVLVGLCLNRSVEMAVALLGILKAGGAYVPIDPQYPRERIAFMLQDSQAAVLIAEERLLDRLPPSLPALVCLDRDREALARESGESLGSDATPNDLAYVIYTSGSTGKPKGVEVTHRSVVNLLASMRREPGISERDCLLAVTTLAFDIAGLEFYLPLVSGARLIIAPSETVFDGEALSRTMQSFRVTIMQATPATWHLLFESGWRGAPGLKILCGGEAMSRELANRLVATGSPVWNMYGPTETTIWSTIHRVKEGDGPVPIGRAIGNTQIHVLDEFGQPVPSGVPGELYIGGEGVARGYLRRPELTAEKFVASPFHSGERLYRTGDLTRRLPDGSVEYIARLDFQVKIRGFRIELNEIETVLEQQVGVRQAVAVVREDSPNDQRLTAYIIPESHRVPTPRQLREALLAVLPDYMVPASFVTLNAFPLTPNGKVDRRALPPPEAEPRDSADFVAPATELERRIAAIWQELLHVPQVSRHDTFFELNGHSLLIVQLQASLRKRLNREITLLELFENPTVAGIARLLDEKEDAKRVATAEVSPGHADWKCLVPVQTEGKRTPLFFVVGYLDPEETHEILSRLVPHLGPDQPIYGLRPRWMGGHGKAYASIGEMASECLADIRSVQPKGPYLIGGYCVAGSVAFEMAHQMVREGEEVGMLALIDAARPTALRSLVMNFWHLAFSSFSLNRAAHIVDVIGQIVSGRSGARKELAMRLLRRKLGWFADMPDVPIVDPLAPVKLSHWRLLHRYRPEPYPGRVLLIACEEWYRFDRPGWAGVVNGGLDCHQLPGDHMALLTVHSSELVRLLFAAIEFGGVVPSS